MACASENYVCGSLATSWSTKILHTIWSKDLSIFLVLWFPQKHTLWAAGAQSQPLHNPCPLILQCPNSSPEIPCPFTGVWDHVRRSDGHRRRTGHATIQTEWLSPRAPGYTLEVHAVFWAEISSGQRSKLVTGFTSRAKQPGGGGGGGAKTSARVLGIKTPDYKTAAQIVVGYVAFEWVQMDWAAPRWVHVPTTPQSWQRRPATGPQERRRGRPRYPSRG